MEKPGRGGDFFRPPPTSPRGHYRKKLCREGPPRSHSDSYYPHRPRSPPSSVEPLPQNHHDSPPDSKPPMLGSYVIQHGPSPAIEHKIRGRSVASPEKEQARSDDGEPTSLSGLEAVFCSSLNTIFSRVHDIESVAAEAGFSASHPISVAAAGIRPQLGRLRNVYDSIGPEVERMANDVIGRCAAREDELTRQVEKARAATHELACTKTDLDRQVCELKSAAAGTETELCKLRSELEDARSRYGELETQYREEQQRGVSLAAERHRLEDTVRRRDAEIENAAAENRRLLALTREKDSQLEGLKLDILGLQSLARRRDAELAEANVDTTRLSGLLREKEAQISRLSAALPATPTSPLAPLVSDPFFPTTQPKIGQPPPAQDAPALRQPSPGPYIKQEIPDDAASAITGATHSTPTQPLDDSVPQLYQPTPAEPPQDRMQQLYQLGIGATYILAKLFDVERPVTTHNNVLACFLERLAAVPEPTSVTIIKAPAPWQLRECWLPRRRGAFLPLRPSLEEQFAHLCLLLPDMADQRQSEIANGSPALDVLESLLVSLTGADHSAFPQAGLAFLQTMIALSPVVTMTLSEAASARTILLAVMLCELCRTLERTFPSPHRPNLRWDVASILGAPLHAAVDALPIGRLAAALCLPDGGSPQTVKHHLTQGCGDQFCVLRWPTHLSASEGQVRAAAQTGAEAEKEVLNEGKTNVGQVHVAQANTDNRNGTDERRGGDGADEREIGLLRLQCGDHTAGNTSNNNSGRDGSSGGGSFLIIDFTERSLRLVDCSLACMAPNAAEPRKLDLVVARPGAGDKGKDDELFRVAAAPRDVAAFWVKYALGDI